MPHFEDTNKILIYFNEKVVALLHWQDTETFAGRVWGEVVACYWIKYSKQKFLYPCVAGIGPNMPVPQGRIVVL